MHSLKFIQLYKALKKQSNDPTEDLNNLYHLYGNLYGINFNLEYIEEIIAELTYNQIIELLCMPNLFASMQFNHKGHQLITLGEELFNKISTGFSEGEITQKQLITLLNYTFSKEINDPHHYKYSLKGRNNLSNLISYINNDQYIELITALDYKLLFPLLMQQDINGRNPFMRLCQNQSIIKINHALKKFPVSEQLTLLTIENKRQSAAINNIISRFPTYNPRQGATIRTLNTLINNIFEDFSIHPQSLLKLLLGTAYPIFPIPNNEEANQLIYKNFLWPALRDTQVSDCEEKILQQLVKKKLKNILKETIRSQGVIADISQSKLEDPNNLLGYIINYSRSDKRYKLGSTESYQMVSRQEYTPPTNELTEMVSRQDYTPPTSELTEMSSTSSYQNQTDWDEEEEETKENNPNSSWFNLIADDTSAEEVINHLNNCATEEKIELLNKCYIDTKNTLCTKIIKGIYNSLYAMYATNITTSQDDLLNNFLNLLNDIPPQKIYQYLNAQDCTGRSNIILLFKAISLYQPSALIPTLEKITELLTDTPRLTLKLLLDESNGCFLQIKPALSSNIIELFNNKINYPNLQQEIYNQFILPLLTNINIGDCPTNIIITLCSKKFKSMLRNSGLQLDSSDESLLGNTDNLLGLIVNYHRTSNSFRIGETETYSTLRNSLTSNGVVPRFSMLEWLNPNTPINTEIKEEEDNSENNTNRSTIG